MIKNKSNSKNQWVALLIGLVAGILMSPASAGAEPFYPWQAQLDAIPKPIGGLKGDPVRGRLVAKESDNNCLACHLLPIEEEEFHGTIGPPLLGIGSRLSAGQIRLRIADETVINPATVMPAFYRDPKTLYGVLDEYYGKTMLTAQEVEDLVAYLVSLK